MDFARNLKRICSEKGTSPTTLLTSLGLSTSKVALWNAGSLPKAPLIIKLAETLGCEPYEFFMDEPKKSDKPQNSVTLTEDETEILTIYRSLTRRQQHEFMVDLYHRDQQS